MIKIVAIKTKKPVLLNADGLCLALAVFFGTSQERFLRPQAEIKSAQFGRQVTF
jgi:hypothetical protein